MNKEDVLEIVKDWLDKAPTFADFGIVDDIKSDDNIIQIFY